MIELILIKRSGSRNETGNTCRRWEKQEKRKYGEQQNKNKWRKEKQVDEIKQIGQNCHCSINVFHSIGYTPNWGNENLA